ncbi:hypothetical protein VNO80_15733 [Phaseolus coccineus]|uniref:Uncharacterized protein n=1 Tax=Phaseolus coccineus TaxID=3886 RepID=A0AAN9MKS6_PHACN
MPSGGQPEDWKPRSDREGQTSCPDQCGLDQCPGSSDDEPKKGSTTQGPSGLGGRVILYSIAFHVGQFVEGSLSDYGGLWGKDAVGSNGGGQPEDWKPRSDREGQTSCPDQCGLDQCPGSSDDEPKKGSTTQGPSGLGGRVILYSIAFHVGQFVEGSLSDYGGLWGKDAVGSNGGRGSSRGLKNGSCEG